MIKCKAKMSAGAGKIKAKGNIKELTAETMAIIYEIYWAFKKENKEEAAERYRNDIFAFILDPNSPLYKEEEAQP